VRPSSAGAAADHVACRTVAHAECGPSPGRAAVATTRPAVRSVNKTLATARPRSRPTVRSPRNSRTVVKAARSTHSSPGKMPAAAPALESRNSESSIHLSDSMSSHMNGHWPRARGAISSTYPADCSESTNASLPADSRSIFTSIPCSPVNFRVVRSDLEASAGTTLNGAAERTAARGFRF
jgi:hypothetical protein